jgi:nucleotide-binding universal stress UspA family protein
MNLLVGIDLSQSTEKVVEKAVEIASALSAKIWLLHVADPEPDFVGFDTSPPYDRNARSKTFHIEHSRLQAIADKLRLEGQDVTALLVQGPTAEMILKEASKLDADMVIVGSHGRGAIRRLLMGSVSEGVLRKSDCPVLLIPTHGRTESE